MDDSHLRSQITDLESKIHNQTIALGVLIAAAIVLGFLWLGANSASNAKSDMISTCTREIGDLSDHISSDNSAFDDVNGKLDDISSAAGDAEGDTYDNQYDALDSISGDANDAKYTDYTDAPSTQCEEPSTSSSSSE